MSDSPQKPNFGIEIGDKANRKLRVRRNPSRSVWAGLGFFGLIGWSVVVPTILGAVAGRWLDRAYPGDRNWTMVMLVAGLCLGCFNAWHWVAREHREIRREQEEDLSNDQ